MNQKFSAAILVLALGLVFLLGLTANSALQSSPEARAALARQERARAAQLEAQAAEAQARANAALEAQSSIVYFWRWAYVGAGAGLLILFIGAAVVGVRWLSLRASIVYPANGQAPLIMRSINGEFVILDPARSLTGITTAKQIGPPTEAAQIQIATQAQAAAVMTAVASKGAGEDVAKRISRAAELLPAPTFAASQDGIRMVYVRQGGGTTEAQRDLQDLREFIQGASVRGLSRRAWLGHKFASGHAGTRARYESLIERCSKAGVIRPDGQSHVLAVSESEALDAFGIGEADHSPTLAAADVVIHAQTSRPAHPAQPGPVIPEGVE